VADNVAITAGSGTSVATDDIGGVHHQRVKLSLGADGTAADAPGDGTNGLDVDVTRLPALVAGTANIGDVDVLTVPADPFGANADAASATGSISAKLRSIAATGIPVTSLPALVAGTANIGDVDVLTLPALVAGTANIGDVDVLTLPAMRADDAAFTIGTSETVAAGLLAVAHGSQPDEADALDQVIGITNRARVQYVIGGHPNVVTVKHTTITTAVTDAAIITISTGSKIVVTAITATLDNASTVFPTLLVGFGAANTPTTTGVILAHGGVPAGGGVNRGDGGGIIGIGADNEDLRVTTTGNATGNGLQIVVTYYIVST
jgi:hypothetical protein